VFPSIAVDWKGLLAVIAMLTMTVGNVTALLQTKHEADARLLEHRARRVTSWSAVVAGAPMARPLRCSTWPCTRR